MKSMPVPLASVSDISTPAQKWPKDRRGRALSWDDTGHYQQIVKIFSETDRIIREIELPLD